MSSDQKTLSDLALEYAGKGYLVLPLKERAKVPACKHGVKDATTAPDQIRRWWDENPNYNIGIAGGREVLIVDVDPRNGGSATLNTLVQTCGQLAYGTAVVLTGSGGHHYYVRYEGEALRKDDELRPGIDLQGEGRYVVAPGSIHENGNVYKLETHDGEMPAINSLVPLPQSYAVAFRTHSTKPIAVKKVSTDRIVAIRAEVAAMPDSIEGHDGSGQLLKVARHIIRQGLIGPEGYEIFAEYATERSTPAWDEKGQQGYRRKWDTALSTASATGDVQFNSNADDFDAIPGQADLELGPVLLWMDKVEALQVDWLWKNRIPIGCLTLLSGHAGLGKSYLLCDLAARVSQGDLFPNGSPCAPGKVLLMSGEDCPNRTIKPRLEACGAKCENIALLNTVRYLDGKRKPVEDMVSLADVGTIRAALQQMGDCRLIVIDPLGAFAGEKCDINAEISTRAVLAPIVALAAEYRAALVVIVHLRKDATGRADDNVMGSRALTAFARTVWHMSRDPEDKERRLLLSGKNNLAELQQGLAFKIDRESSKVVWEDGLIDLTADDALELSRGPAPDKRNAAEDLLLVAMREKDMIPVKELIELARKRGISERTIQRAAKDLRYDRVRNEPRGPYYYCKTNDSIVDCDDNYDTETTNEN